MKFVIIRFGFKRLGPVVQSLTLPIAKFQLSSQPVNTIPVLYISTASNS